MINMVLGVVVTAMVTRLLGPEIFGSYVLLLSLGAILQLVADFGLYLTLGREMAQNPQGENEILSQIASLRLFLLLSVFTLAAVVIYFMPRFQFLFWSFVVVAAGLIFQSLSQLFMGVYQYYQSVWRATAGDLLGRLAQILGVAVVGFYAATLDTMVAMFALSTAVAYLMHQVLLPVKKWRLVIRWADWRRIAATSWPLGAMLLVNAIYFRVDVLILSWFRPTFEVGWYGAAYRVVESFLFFPAMLGGLLLPRLAESLRDGKTDVAGKYIGEGLVLVLATGLYVLVILGVFSKGVVMFIAGGSFIEAAPLLSVLSVALAIMFAGNLFGFSLVAMKKQLLLLNCYVVLAVFNTVANIMFVPFYGAMAAAWTTVLTELAATSYAAYHVTRGVKLDIRRFCLPRLFVVGLFSFGAAYFLPAEANLFVKIIVVTLLYLVLLYLAGILEWRKFSMLGSTALSHRK